MGLVWCFGAFETIIFLSCDYVCYILILKNKSFYLFNSFHLNKTSHLHYYFYQCDLSIIKLYVRTSI